MKETYVFDEIFGCILKDKELYKISELVDDANNLQSQNKQLFELVNELIERAFYNCENCKHVSQTGCVTINNCRLYKESDESKQFKKKLKEITND